MRAPLSLPRNWAAAAALALPLAAWAGAPDDAWSGELRLQAEPVQANQDGLLAQADALAPGLVPRPRGSAAVELGLRAQAHGLSADALLRHERSEGGHTESLARFNELYASGAVPGLGESWVASAGRKIVSWDVGYAWRPNDVVQQEERRQLIGTTPQGRSVLTLEHFGAETAWTLAWANPQHLHAAWERSAGADESALALRAYVRQGAADWHGFARWGEHTQGSVGAAVAWVASEAMELHASWRFAQAHDGWARTGPAAATLSAADPWALQTLGAASQVLVGFTWTNADQFSVLGEAWHDGAAVSDADWSRWQQRVQALGQAAATAPGPMRTAYAANLAWEATPWQSTNLRRDNLFLRLSWQHGAWQPSVDLLYTPRDGGRTVTASLVWQGDRLKLEGGWRAYGGPAEALLARVPLRRAGYLRASYAF